MSYIFSFQLNNYKHFQNVFWNRDSSVGIATRLRAGRSGFDSRQGQEFASASRPALGPTQPPIQSVSRVVSLVVKRPGR
jgi:hypothetical protein